MHPQITHFLNVFLEKKNRQNGVKRLSAFCQIMIFGIMSVHRINHSILGMVCSILGSHKGFKVMNSTSPKPK